MTAVIKRVEEEGQSRTSARAWTLEQRVQAWYIHGGLGLPHPHCWSFATLLSWAFDPVRPRPNEGNVHTSSSAATVYVVLHDGQTFFFFFIFPNFQWQRGEQCCASVFFIVQYCSALIPLFFHSTCSQCQQSLKCQTKCDKDDDRGWEEGGTVTTLLLSDPKQTYSTTTMSNKWFQWG